MPETARWVTTGSLTAISFLLILTSKLLTTTQTPPCSHGRARGQFCGPCGHLSASTGLSALNARWPPGAAASAQISKTPAVQRELAPLPQTPRDPNTNLPLLSSHFEPHQGSSSSSSCKLGLTNRALHHLVPAILCLAHAFYQNGLEGMVTRSKLKITKLPLAPFHVLVFSLTPTSHSTTSGGWNLRYTGKRAGAQGSMQAWERTWFHSAL